MYKLIALGVDNKIHCCGVDNKSISCCEGVMPIKQVNPDFTKLRAITWCYECNSLLGMQGYLMGKITLVLRTNMSYTCST